MESLGEILNLHAQTSYGRHALPSTGDGEMEAQGSAVSKLPGRFTCSQRWEPLSEVEERAASGNNILSTSPDTPNQRPQAYLSYLGGGGWVE